MSVACAADTPTGFAPKHRTPTIGNPVSSISAASRSASKPLSLSRLATAKASRCAVP
jgi:hypothetical protein